jgi:hypothetical protein
MKLVPRLKLRFKRMRSKTFRNNWQRPKKNALSQKPTERLANIGKLFRKNSWRTSCIQGKMFWKIFGLRGEDEG